MAKIRHTKNELKAQRDALQRFVRYLPTLQLKKQQLQMEIRGIDAQLATARAAEERLRSDLESWIVLFSESFDFAAFLGVQSIRRGSGNIAGVDIPVLEELLLSRSAPDMWETPEWVDRGLDVLEKLLRLQVERTILEEQHQLLAEELRTTAQRVNLFEKVKIPECKEHIRVIRIFLGDEQTAAVARAKIAKKKGEEVEAAA